MRRTSLFLAGVLVTCVDQRYRTQHSNQTSVFDEDQLHYRPIKRITKEQRMLLLPSAGGLRRPLRNDNGCSRSGTMVVWAAMIFSLLFLLNSASIVDAQRTVASLGTKRKRTQSEARNFKKSEDGYVLEGEQQLLQDQLLAWTRDDPERFVTGVVVTLVTILLILNPFSRRKRTTEGDGEYATVLGPHTHVGNLETCNPKRFHK